MRQSAKIGLLLGALAAAGGVAHWSGMLKFAAVSTEQDAGTNVDDAAFEKLSPEETPGTSELPVDAPDAGRAEPAIPAEPGDDAAATAEASTPEVSPPASTPADSTPAAATATNPETPAASAPSAARIGPIVPPVKRVTPKTPPAAAEPGAKKGAEKAAKAASGTEADKGAKKK